MLAVNHLALGHPRIAQVSEGKFSWLPAEGHTMHVSQVGTQSPGPSPAA